MSRMSDLHILIQEEIERGQLSFGKIASKFGVPRDWVDQVMADLLEQYRMEDEAAGYPWDEIADVEGS